MAIYGKVISNEEAAAMLGKKPSEITPELLGDYARQTRFGGEAEAQARGFLEDCKNKYGNGISAKVIISNFSGYKMRFKDMKLWHGYLGETSVDDIIGVGQQSALFFHHTNGAATGSEGALIYELLDDEGNVVKEVFYGWDIPFSGSNCTYTEVREKGHWWKGTNEQYMLSIMENNSKQTLRSEWYGSVSTATIGNDSTSYVSFGATPAVAAIQSVRALTGKSAVVSHATLGIFGGSYGCDSVQSEEKPSAIRARL